MKMLEKKGIPTHLVEELNDRETVVRKVQIVPLEVIVRNVAAGSLAKRLGLEVQVTEMAVRNYELDKAPEHAAFYARLFREAFMAANAGGNGPLTAVCIWGLLDCPQLPHDNYSWKLNSPYGGLFTDKLAVKTSFDQVWHALKGE